MTDEIPFPPAWQKLSADELRLSKQHLLNEIAREASEPTPLTTKLFGRGRRQSMLSGVRPILVAPVVLLTALAFVPIGGASLGARAANDISGLWNSTPANQPSLDAAADDAQSVAGSAYYTDAVVNDAANTVDVYLAGAPQSVVAQLQSLHPGIYVIDNDAAHPLSVLLALRNSLPLAALGAEGIHVVSAGATPDGYLKVGVSSSTDVQAAQAAFDSADGAGIIQVYGGAQPGVGTPATGTVNTPSAGIPRRAKNSDRRR